MADESRHKRYQTLLHPHNSWSNLKMYGSQKKKKYQIKKKKFKKLKNKRKTSENKFTRIHKKRS